jgi:hypothetical protein
LLSGNDFSGYFGRSAAPPSSALRIPVMAIGYSSRRRSLIPVIAIMAGRQSKAGHDGSAARRRWRKQRLQD